MTSMVRACFLAVAAALLLAPGPARAGQGDVPALFTQTGRLFDNHDQPITGSVTMVFAIYDLPTGGEPAWTETHTINFDDGYFVASLGETKPLPALDGTPKFLGIRVADDPEMTPREELVSVPYALMAGDVAGNIHPQSVSIGTRQ